MHFCLKYTIKTLPVTTIASHESWAVSREDNKIYDNSYNKFQQVGKSENEARILYTFEKKGFIL